jgi:hypothetical protein
MITTPEALRRSLEQLQRVYEALAALRTEYPRASASWLAVMAEGWIDQAEQLRREVEEYTGVAALEESKAELWLAITGPGIGDGNGRTSVLTALLDALRKGVQAVAEFLHTGHLARRPSAALKEACDWNVLALNPGSLKVGVRLPEPPQQPHLWENIAAEVRQAVRHFLDVAAWAAADGEGPEALDRRFPDEPLRRLLLNAVKPFVPRPRGAVESVILSGRLAPATGPIILTRSASPRISRAIDRTTARQVEDHVGELREIDLDNLSMVIRYTADVKEVRCTFDGSLLEAAREALDRRVQVSGVREMAAGRVSPTLHVLRLEVLDEPPTALEGEPESALTSKP